MSQLTVLLSAVASTGATYEQTAADRVTALREYDRARLFELDAAVSQAERDYRRAQDALTAFLLAHRDAIKVEEPTC